MRLKNYLTEAKLSGRWFQVKKSFLLAMDEELTEFQIQFLPEAIFINEGEITIYDYMILLDEESLRKLLSSDRKGIKNLLSSESLNKHIFMKEVDELYNRKYEFTGNKTIGQLFIKPRNVKSSTFLENAEKTLYNLFYKHKKNDVRNLEVIKRNFKGKIYVHMSYKKYHVGDIIKPYWDPTELSKNMIGGRKILGMEDYFESLRPSNKPSRENSAFAFLEIEDALSSFGKYGTKSDRNIYFVEALGKTHIADMNIVDSFEAEAAEDYDEDDFEQHEEALENLVKKYWSGKPGSTKPKWEIIASNGLKIVYSPFD